MTAAQVSCANRQYRFLDQQLGQLYELMQAIQKKGRDGTGNEP